MVIIQEGDVRYYLVTVQSVQASGSGLKVTPTIRLEDLMSRSENQLMPMKDDPLELRTPDGAVRAATVGMFGIDCWQDENGRLITASDPSDPHLTLSIGGGVAESEVPAGTEVWIPA
jgi:hypothetical protein